jgi:hypothetical protein
MHRYLLPVMLLSAPFALTVLVPMAHAAKSPAMESCSAEWKKMKDAGTIQSGQTWPKFWSQCSKDYAAAHPDAAAGQQDTQVAPAAKKAASAKAAKADESDTTGSGAQKKQCDAKWASYKSQSGAHGWHDYFQFMAKCM